MAARHIIIVVFATAALAGCSARQPSRVAQKPAAAPVLPPAAESRAVPVQAAIPSELPKRQAVDIVAMDIADAQAHFDRGAELFASGTLKEAKTEFDLALDILLKSSTYNPSDARLRSQTTELLARIHALELAAIRDGEGTASQKTDHAVIDDLAGVDAFPGPVDPKMREAVEDQVKRTGHDLPIEINDRVLSFLEYYQNGRGRNTMAVGLERLGHYREMMESILLEEDVPLNLVHLAQAESAFLPLALSRAKARGLWQFISSRGKEYGLRQTWWLDERSDPEKATRAAARHLRDLYDEFGDWYLAMAAYNSGPYRVSSALRKTGSTSFWELADKKALPKETINYVPTVLALTIIGSNPEKYGFDVTPAPARAVERIAVPEATDLRVIAEAINFPVEDLKEMNPHVLRWTTPPDDSEFELILPKGYGETFALKVANLPANERLIFRYHAVSKGETLSAIAKKYGVAVEHVTQANNISVKKTLSIGQTLLIPVSGTAPSAAAARAAVRTVSTISTARPSSYTVRRGDTLSGIATQFGITVNQLKAWNKLSSNRIDAGMKLAVSAPAVPSPKPPETPKILHKVQQGETLDKIASEYKTTVGDILAWNKTDDLTVIHPGDQITIFPGN
jgi:membrane-bound lytic murein transglycosylase D